jgi:sphinganine-1-phosphate aldolase
LPENYIESSCYVRDHAEKVLGIGSPEAVAGVTAHPALDKACHYLKVKLVKVPVDPVSQR